VGQECDALLRALRALVDEILALHGSDRRIGPASRTPLCIAIIAASAALPRTYAAPAKCGSMTW